MAMVAGIENIANVVLVMIALFKVKCHKANELTCLFQKDRQEIVTPGEPFCNSFDFLRGCRPLLIISSEFGCLILDDHFMESFAVTYFEVSRDKPLSL